MAFCSNSGFGRLVDTDVIYTGPSITCGGTTVNPGDTVREFLSVVFLCSNDIVVDVEGNSLPIPDGTGIKVAFVGPGTYTQSGGPDVVVPSGHMGILNWDGSVWYLGSSVEMPDNSAKIEDWVAGTYEQDEVVTVDGVIYRAKEQTNEEPPSEKWEAIGGIGVEGFEEVKGLVRLTEKVEVDNLTLTSGIIAFFKDGAEIMGDKEIKALSFEVKSSVPINVVRKTQSDGASFSVEVIASFLATSGFNIFYIDEVLGPNDELGFHIIGGSSVLYTKKQYSDSISLKYLDSIGSNEWVYRADLFPSFTFYTEQDVLRPKGLERLEADMDGLSVVDSRSKTVFPISKNISYNIRYSNNIVYVFYNYNKLIQNRNILGFRVNGWYRNGLLTVIKAKNVGTSDFTVVDEYAVQTYLGKNKYDINISLNGDEVVGFRLEEGGARPYYSDELDSPNSVGMIYSIDGTVWNNRDYSLGIELIIEYNGRELISVEECASKNTYCGKSLWITGDSISALQHYVYPGNVYHFSSVDDIWFKRLLDLTGMWLLGDDGWSGSRMSGSANSSVQNRLDRLPENADVHICFIGVNDLRANVPLGDFSEPYNTNTFTGAYMNAISYWLEHRPNCKLILTSLNNYYDSNGEEYVNSNGDTVDTYSDRIKEIAKKMRVQFVDLRTTFNKYNYIVFMPDGLHPNTDGSPLIGENIYSQI